jgi:hypothetical protein
VPFVAPIHRYSDLPPSGRLDPDAQERAWLDFKREVASDELHTMAKDVAAFANAFGGTILVGVQDREDGIVHVGIELSVARRLQERYQDAAKTWCEPYPHVLPTLVALPERPDVVLAVNIEPCAAGVVGVNIAVPDSNGRFARRADAWLFPVRVGSHTKALSPQEAAMHLDVHVRSVSIRLCRALAEGGSVVLYGAPAPTRASNPNPYGHSVVIPGGPPPLVFHRARLVEVNVESGRALFIVTSTEEGGVGDRETSVPLREVEDVWRRVPTGWGVRVRGRIITTGNVTDAYQPVL